MFRFSESKTHIFFEFSSEMRLVDRVVNDARTFLAEHGFNAFSEFKIVLRELLINAVEHGNKKNPDKIVTCIVTQADKEEFEIHVQDQGDGFDYNRLDFIMPDTRQPRLRGYPLIKEFSEEIRFNPAGNSVFVTFCFKNETAFDIREQNEWLIIRPNGDITATVADKFRLLLMDFIRKNHSRFRFDLENVRDMDSVALGVFFILPTALAGKEFELEIINARQDLKNLFRVTMLNKEYRVI